MRDSELGTGGSTPRTTKDFEAGGGGGGEGVSADKEIILIFFLKINFL
jgi:hypothetical protein